MRGGVTLNDFTGAAHIYIACGYTDLRRGIDGLAGIVEREFHQQCRWLMEGLKVEQPHAHKAVHRLRIT